MVQGLVPSVDEGGLHGGAACQGKPFFQTLEILAVEGLVRLDLHGLQLFSALDHDVHLVAGAVPPEIQIAGQALVVARFQHLAEDEGFEKRPALGVGVQLLGTLDGEQPAGQARIDEVEFGGLDEPFVEVLVVGGEQENDVAGLQERDPGLGGVVGDAAVGGQGREVEELAGAAGA